MAYTLDTVALSTSRALLCAECKAEVHVEPLRQPLGVALREYAFLASCVSGCHGRYVAAIARDEIENCDGPAILAGRLAYSKAFALVPSDVCQECKSLRPVMNGYCAHCLRCLAEKAYARMAACIDRDVFREPMIGWNGEPIASVKSATPVEEHDPVVVEPPRFDEYVKVTPIPVACERLERDGLTSIYHYGEGRFWVRGEARRERSLRSGLVTR